MPTVYDLVVIGGGPAGLAAATQGASLRLSTLLLDEQTEVGGQIYRAVGSTPLRNPAIVGPEYQRGRELARDFAASGAEYRGGATVFDITPDRFIGYEREGTAHFVQARRIVLATGALERPFPIPGWTLPGVMTAGAAQILLKSAGVVPGRRTVLAGTGPLLYLLAAQLVRSGHPVQALLDTAEGANYVRALADLPRALKRASYLAKGLGLIRALRRAGVRHVTGVTDISAQGSDWITSVSYRCGPRKATLETDTLLLHQGVVPNIQLTQALRCEHRWDEAQLCWKPVTDLWGDTSVSGVAVAGDGSGIGGAIAAEHRGRISAIAAGWHLQRIDAAERDRMAAQSIKALGRELAIRPLLDRLYRPADRLRIPDGEATLVCRCEEVTMGDVRRSVELGCTGPNQLKAFVRAGMGPCQGRLCGLTVCEAIAKERNVAPAEVGYYRLRPPVKPIALGALAAMTPPEPEAELGQSDTNKKRAESVPATSLERIS